MANTQKTAIFLKKKIYKDMEIWYGFLFHNLLAWLPKLCLHLTYQLNAPQSSDGWSVPLTAVITHSVMLIKHM